MPYAEPPALPVPATLPPGIATDAAPDKLSGRALDALLDKLFELAPHPLETEAGAHDDDAPGGATLHEGNAQYYAAQLEDVL